MRKEKKLRKHMPAIGGGLLIIAIVGALYLFGASLGGGQPPEPPEIQTISVIVPPPPPPPPPPEMEKPPEPEIEEIDVPEPEPEPVDEVADSDEAPPNEDLGLDTDGVAGSDGFGLKAKKGGRGLIGGGGDREGWYASRMEKDIQSVLARNRELRRQAFTVTLKLWIADNGAISDSELLRGSGNREIDRNIELALRTQARIKNVPPDEMQPITLRIASRS